MKPWTADRWFQVLLCALVGLAVLLAIAPVIGISTYLANLVGQLAAFAILALSLDLVWGFLGILTLGQGLFFGIGGYIVAMHLLKHAYDVSGRVPDFVRFMGWSHLPFYWAGFGSFTYAMLVAAVVTLVVAGLFGLASFRSRIGGVYFAIVTQALVYVAMLLFYRNDTGFGGNNGMTGFTLLFGWPIGLPAVTVALASASVGVLALVLLGCRLLLDSRYGALMLATRDDEVRLLTLGYDTVRLKLAVWCLAALIAALAGVLYVPQVGIVNPRILSPDLSLEIAVWVAIGGRGHLVGAVIGAMLVNALKFWLTSAAPELWPFILSALIVLVVLVFPNGLVDLATWTPRRKPAPAGPAAGMEVG